MAGTVEVGRGAEWSAATWVYEWALEIAIETVRSDELRTKLRDAVDSNFGWLSIGDFAPDEQQEILSTLQRNLVTESDRRLPATVPNRDEVLALLRELSELAGQHHAG